MLDVKEAPNVSSLSCNILTAKLDYLEDQLTLIVRIMNEYSFMKLGMHIMRRDL